MVYYFDLLGYEKSDKSDDDISLGIRNKLLDALINHGKIELPFVIDPFALSPWGVSIFQTY
ncbi:MAG: hypothetical protein ACI9RG_000701 [Sulfurimonas sp.]|jgi:hypothetical protein